MNSWGVKDACRFLTDPDPHIRTSDWRIRIRETQKPTDPDPEQWYIYIILQRSKVTKKWLNSRNQGFLTIFADDGRIGTPEPDPYCWLTDPGGPKTYGSGSATLLLGKRDYKEYEPCWLDKGFSLHLTWLYIFSGLFIPDVLLVGHPSGAYMYPCRDGPAKQGPVFL